MSEGQCDVSMRKLVFLNLSKELGFYTKNGVLVCNSILKYLGNFCFGGSKFDFGQNSLGVIYNGRRWGGNAPS